MPPNESERENVETREGVPRRKRDLVSTAVDLFNRHGFTRVTIGEICTETGASKATFYRYFDNKDDLIRYILERIADRYERRVDAVEAMDVPFVEKVRILVDDHLEQTRRTSDAFIEDFYRTDGEVRDDFNEMLARNQRRFLDFIAKAQQRSEIRPEIKHPFILAMLGKLNELLAQPDLRHEYPDYESLMREIVDFFFHGIFPASSET